MTDPDISKLLNDPAAMEEVAKLHRRAEVRVEEGHRPAREDRGHRIPTASQFQNPTPPPRPQGFGQVPASTQPATSPPPSNDGAAATNGQGES